MKEPEYWRITAAAEKVIARHETEIEFLNLMDEVKDKGWLYLPIGIANAAAIAQRFHFKCKKADRVES